MPCPACDQHISLSFCTSHADVEQHAVTCCICCCLYLWDAATFAISYSLSFIGETSTCAAAAASLADKGRASQGQKGCSSCPSLCFFCCLLSTRLLAQEKLVAGKYMRATAEASVADKGRAKGKKAAKRAGAGSSSLQGFRKYTTPAGLQVSIQVMIVMLVK